MTIVSVYVLFASLEEAERIGRQMVEERLAACVNLLGPCRSIYRWHGAVDDAEEFPAIFKTSGSQADALIARIASLHSYEIPCVVQWPIEKPSVAYAEWVRDNVG